MRVGYLVEGCVLVMLCVDGKRWWLFKDSSEGEGIENKHQRL